MSAPRRKNVRDRKLHVERLEERTLLAGDLELLADVNQTAASGAVVVSSALSQVAIGNTLYFASSDATHGTELWKTDGTVAGTVMVKDINPGVAGSNPFQLTNVGGTLYFVAQDGGGGADLWKTDGTASGTVLVKNLVGGDGRDTPTLHQLTNLNGTLLFSKTLQR